MTHTHAIHKPEKPGWLRRTRLCLSHMTSEVLPPIFGDAVSPDMKVLRAQVEEARHEIQEVPAPPAVHGGRSKPARWN